MFVRSACITNVCAVVGLVVAGVACPVHAGAHDRIMTGESTFMVEMQEAAAVLHSASRASLVVLDELGRGTSTHDGHALAHSTLHHLVRCVGARTLFATHYQGLTQEVRACHGWQEQTMQGHGEWSLECCLNSLYVLAALTALNAYPSTAQPDLSGQ